MAGGNEETVRALIEALNQKDWNRFGELLHPDLTYELQSYHLPGAAPMDKATTLAALPGLVATVFDADSPQLEVTHVVAQGDWVVAEVRGSGRFHEGTEYENRYVHVYEVVDGLVRTDREYMDTQHMAMLFERVMPAS
ncbi:nuclear transport factor 2 family protein [Geodermatophilus sp. URMC 61]|jgi:ketosteroid isomerase-like protein|uniref:nuclear transport factor 2 family protein n=1 Tax=Geodermatophilus sp. URMC 61 TaxID=3423411 RepID=UPI00406C50E8